MSELYKRALDIENCEGKQEAWKSKGDSDKILQKIGKDKR